MINPFSVCSTVLTSSLPYIRDLKQGRRRRQWKRRQKMDLRSFKLNRVYLNPLNMSNAGDVSWSWILKDFIQDQRGRKIRRRMFTSSTSRQIRRFYVEVVQWTSKKCTKKRDTRVELLFSSLNLLFFWSRRCGRSPVKLWFSIKLTATEFFSSPFNCWMAI